jgi:hypothetical protein
MTAKAPTPTIDLSFSHTWQAEILPARPLILPNRRFVYPLLAEEVERGALELLVRPAESSAKPFLATCALGFRDTAVPSGLWSTPQPECLCAVSGGYAYMIDTADPQLFTMIPFRPVLEVRALFDEGLLLFVCHRNLVAWGAEGMAWESEKLSDEGLTVESIEGGILHGRGWTLKTDKDTPFALDLGTGLRVP